MLDEPVDGDTDWLEYTEDDISKAFWMEARQVQASTISDLTLKFYISSGGQITVEPSSTFLVESEAGLKVCQL